MDKDTQKMLLNLVKDSYEKIASDYDITRKKLHTPLFDKLKEISKEIKDGQRVLDVGSGNGRLLESFKDTKIEYLGVDKSATLVSLAKQNYPDKKFIVGDVLELSQIADLNFDYVFCVALLHHLPGQDLRLAALKQLKNKINQDGKIIISAWNMWSQPRFRKFIFKFSLLKLIGKNKMDFGDILFDWKNSSGLVISKRYYHAFRKYELKKLAKVAGLHAASLYKDGFNYYMILSK